MIPVFSQAVLGFLGGDTGASCRAVDDSIARLEGTEVAAEDAIGLRLFPAVVAPGAKLRWRARWNYAPRQPRSLHLTIDGNTVTLQPGQNLEGETAPIASTRTIEARIDGRRWSFPVHVISDIEALAKKAAESDHPEAAGFSALYARRETNEVEPDWTRLATRVRAVLDDPEARPRGETPLVRFGGTWMRTALPSEGPGVLVVAVHGAGGSENLFFQGYGAGIAARLAAKRRWAFVAPRAGGTAINDAIGFYRWAMGKGPAKIFLIGHSAGGALILRALGAGAKADGAALFAPASGAWPETKPIPTFLAVGAQEIPMLAQSAERLRKARPDVEFLRVDPCEHYLIVGEAAEAAYRFLDNIASE